MKSKASSTNKLSWHSSTLLLGPKNRASKSLQKLHDSGFNKLKDLLWIFPLRVQDAPKLVPFSQIQIDELFLGEGRVLSLNLAPAYGRQGKGRVQLFNATLLVQDTMSENQLNLKFFNVYPSFKKQMETIQNFIFMGTVTDYKGMVQIVNPKINPKDIGNNNDKLIEYPTVNTIPGREVKRIIAKIPEELWNTELEDNVHDLKAPLKLKSLISSFKTFHGKDGIPKDEAMDRIIFEEFFESQLMMLARKVKNKKLLSPVLRSNKDKMQSYFKIFPYELTDDQLKVLRDIQNDFACAYPMMRMIQGDVGSGKTSVALVAALIAIENEGQVALMCPTETLANQHMETFKSLLGDTTKMVLLTGSLKPSEKTKINNNIITGEAQLVIGTHALIQKSVIFKNLTFAIIDEQHKFGVNQRQELYKKGTGVHTLIMSATPIPRTLQLAQYGDLDISTIRSMPKGRKGTKTRIIQKNNYENYLSFIKTRISIGEQIYVVVPAIEESETLSIKNVEGLIQEYKSFFPEVKITALHGQLSSEEKKVVMNEFSKGIINILIATTVIEVGINVLNSSVISIYNPDRFGLSSLHQLRGRVGRGEKPGFCFLIANNEISKDALDRIKIMESTSDGFMIAEADLKNRGAGNLFGPTQSGFISPYRLANIFEHFTQFQEVANQIEMLREKYPEKLNNTLLKLTEETNITSTI